jgi:hypothetical protein
MNRRYGVTCVFRVVAFIRNGSDGLQNIGLVLSFAICLNMQLYGG